METIEEVWKKMIAGEVYDALHPALLEMLESTRLKIWQLNALPPTESEQAKKILRSLLGAHGERFHINMPFRCDYGRNIFIGEDFFANFNLTILDEAEVRFGNNVFVGPNVSIYTACHPVEPEPRNAGVQWAKSVTVGNNVWIGGNVVILPGVTVGDNVVIGAGSVVTKNIPDNSVVAGNPAKLIKSVSKRN